MSFKNNFLSFELHENNTCIKYNYFGELYWSEDGIGVDFNYPEEKTTSAWYNTLNADSSCMSSACLGSLFYHLKLLNDESFNEIFGNIIDIVRSEKFVKFIERWFNSNGGVFSESYFFDGKFGRFSSEGDIGYPDIEDEDSNELKWIEHDVTIILNQNGCFDDLRGKLFIDEEFESKFEIELKAVISLFKVVKI